MSVFPTKLKDKATGNEVDAELHDDLPIEGLFEAEEVWAGERVRFLRDCLRASVRPDELPQSIHWSWSLKAIKMPGFNVGPLSPFRLFGVKAAGNWQGLLLACCVGHLSKLPPGKKDLVYVEFVESAPWNWELSKANRVQRFRGVGTQMIELAVRWSMDLDFQGRLGLHSLPQSEGFYRAVCEMTDLGPDPSYKPPLRYFEFSESQAKTFLGEVMP